MPDVAGRVRRQATSWPADAIAAASLAAAVLAYQGVSGALRGGGWIAPTVVLVWCGALAVRRRWPLGAAAVSSATFVILAALGQLNTLSGALRVFFWTPFLLAYTLGTASGTVTGLAGVVLLVAGLQVGAEVFNPFFEMITLGPWLAGRIIVSRRRLVQQLEARNRDLEAERELFTQEAVRYERARIARELHDIVAHSVSVMVVQAGAGQRLARADPSSAAEALDSIADAARDAQAETGRLVELLGGELPAGRAPGLDMVEELVGRASVTGLTVNCRFLGDCHRLSPAASDAAYRLVQESLTNALKHAPGAPVEITFRDKGSQIEVKVVNPAPSAGWSGLEQSGSGRGLAGMRERVADCGGSVTAGPTREGGWRVSALLPCASALVPPAGF